MSIVLTQNILQSFLKVVIYKTEERMKVKRIESEFLCSNTFIVTEGEQCLIVDAGVKPEVVKKATKNRNVVGVILTHGHFDHVFYAEEYKKLFDCPIYISKQGKITAMDKDLSYGDDFRIKQEGLFNVFDVDKIFKCGDFQIQVIKTPGHCTGCVCYLIDGHLFAGDTLFKTGIGRCDLLNSNKEDMLESLKKLQGLKFKTLHSGHGEDSSFEEQQRNISVFIKYLERRV